MKRAEFRPDVELHRVRADPLSRRGHDDVPAGHHLVLIGEDFDLVGEESRLDVLDIDSFHVVDSRGRAP